MNILITGGAGYIGSHTCIELLNAGHALTVVDNLANSKMESLRRVEKIAGKPLRFHQVDLTDQPGLTAVFRAGQVDAVIHFAGYKAVNESVEKPMLYYRNNVMGSIVLFEVMAAFGVKNLVFSSSCTVYGDPASVPIREDFPLNPANPYGRTKLMVEDMLRDMAVSDPSWNLAILRYFNPVGAHESGLIGEDPNDIPNNLLPYVAQVAVGRRQAVRVFGNDYPTPDGTGVRDYIHVVDLAAGHLFALERLKSNPGILTLNLGTGNGTSVLEMIAAFETASGRPVPYQIVGRRAGDIATAYADPSLAFQETGWKAERDILDMCRDAWKWQSQNPDGYLT
ncbi:MAG: UDP-glucose 4-epimerase GalE [Desulfatirhabdiaceae bacterium]